MDFIYKDDAKTILFKVPNRDTIVIPQNVEVIYGKNEGDYAFKDCASLVTTVTFENGNNLNTISNYAFFKCTKINSIDLSSCSLLLTIGSYAFSGCTGATSVTFPQNTLNSISEYAFDGCRGLLSVNIPASVSSVGARIFSDCRQLKTASIDANSCLEVLTWGAFHRCYQLETFHVPKSVKLFENIFLGCDKLKSVTIDTESPYFNKKGDAILTKNNSIIVFFPPAVTGDYTIDNGVKEIGPCSFASSHLTNIYFSQTVELIHRYAFQHTSKLVKVELPISLKGIMTYAFLNSKVQEVIFPENVDDIGSMVFYGCSKLTRVKMPSTFKTIGGGIFALCPDNINIEFDPNSDFKVREQKIVYNKQGDTIVLYLGQYEEITIKKDVKSIAASVFMENEHLTSVIFEPGSILVDILTKAFYKCKLTSLELPESVHYLNEFCFSCCTNLKTVKLSSSLVQIGGKTFQGCTSLESVEFVGTNEHTILEEAFDGCYTLSKVVLKEGLILISKNAFRGCTNLTKIVIPKTIKTINEFPFSNSGLVTLIIDSQATIEDLPSNFLYNCPSLKNLELPDSIRVLNTYCLANTKIKEFVLPKNVQTIDSFCFMSCTNLTQFTIPEGSALTTINYGVFADCTSFEKIICNSIEFSLINGALYNKEESKLIVVPPKLNVKYFAFSENLHVIGQSALLGCVYIKQILIPTNSVNVIEANAFENCSNLRTINIPECVQNVGKEAFKGCTKLQCGLLIENTTLAFKNNLINNAKLPLKCYNQCEKMCTCVMNARTNIFLSTLIFFLIC